MVKVSRSIMLLSIGAVSLLVVLVVAGYLLAPYFFLVGLAFFAVSYALLGRVTMRAGVRPRLGGLLIAIGALLCVVGVFSLPIFGPESALVTIMETIGALPFGLGFIRLGNALWSRTDVLTKQQPSRVRQAGPL